MSLGTGRGASLERLTDADLTAQLDLNVLGSPCSVAKRSRWGWSCTVTGSRSRPCVLLSLSPSCTVPELVLGRPGAGDALA